MASRTRCGRPQESYDSVTEPRSGTAHIDASSCDHVRHRLSRGGNRQANRVLHTMARVGTWPQPWLASAPTLAHRRPPRDVGQHGVCAAEGDDR